MGILGGWRRCNCVGSRHSHRIERREEWMGGRPAQPASWPGTPGRAGQRAKSARRDPGSRTPRTKTCPRGPRFAHPTDEDLSAGTPVLHPTDEDLSAGTPVRAFARCSHLRIESWGTRLYISRIAWDSCLFEPL